MAYKRGNTLVSQRVYTYDAEENETTTLITYHRFIYRGYLQISYCDLTRSGHPSLWLITWDPTQPVATKVPNVLSIVIYFIR